MPWRKSEIDGYHAHAKTYVSSYKNKIDCADLAISTLVDYAGQKRLPVRLKYYSGGWKWLEFDPASIGIDAKDPRKSASELQKYTKNFSNNAMVKLGALNVIDNTKPILIGMAKAGDLIMSKWSSTLGHTRIIHSVTPITVDKKIKYKVIWYQGNLPPVVPQVKTEYFSTIGGVYESSPRRWKFEQFDR